MKKIISLLLVVFIAATMFAFSACDKETGNEDPTGEGTSNTNETVTELKFGLGIVTTMSEPKDADGDMNGAAELNTTAVAVLLDAEGKIVDVKVDALQANTAWTSEGKAETATEMKTKGELGTDYGMAAYANTKEWDVQAKAFEDTAKGKTVAEVKAMAVDGKPSGDLATAGCTISVTDFIKALDKAVANTAESKATTNDKLGMAFATTVENTDATEEKNGTVEVNATVSAVVTDKDGKVVVAKTDVAQINVTFDLAGASTTDATAELKTKGELGTDYGMSTYANTKEWDVQADAFDKALVGKTSADFAALADADNKGTGDLATAGCTIEIGDMIKAATKAATVA